MRGLYAIDASDDSRPSNVDVSDDGRFVLIGTAGGVELWRIDGKRMVLAVESERERLWVLMLGLPARRDLLRFIFWRETRPGV